MKISIISVRNAIIFGLLILGLTLMSCKLADNERVVDWGRVSLKIDRSEQSRNILASTSGTIQTTFIMVVAGSVSSVSATTYHQLTPISETVDIPEASYGILPDSGIIELTLPLDTPFKVVQVNFFEELTQADIMAGTTPPFSVGISTEITVSGAGSVDVSIAFGPHVVSISPADGATGIAVSAGVTVTFNEAMDETSITVNSTDTRCTGSIQISADNFANCIRLSAEITVSSDKTAFTFSPVSGLAYNATYKIKVTTSVADANGNAFGSEFTMDNGFSSIVAYSIGGTIRGLVPGMNLVLQNLGAENLTVSANGTFAFNTPLLNSVPYAVTIATPPSMGNCFLSNASGTVAAADVTSVSIICLMGGAVQGTAIDATTTNTLVSTFAGTGAQGSNDGPAATATFDEQTSITTNGTSLFVADQANHAIREIDFSTNEVSTVASGLLNPWGITTDGINLYVADTSNHVIRQIAIVDGAMTTLAGSEGTSGFVDNTFGTDAKFDGPRGITTDGVNLYVVDSNNYRIRKIVISNPYNVSTLAGNGVAGSVDNTIGTSASFDYSAGITTIGNALFVADQNNHKIRKIELSGTNEVSTIAGTTSGFADGAGLTTAQLNQPTGISTNGIDLFVTDRGNSRIRRIVISTGVVTTIAGTGNTATFDNGAGNVATFYFPDGIIVNDQTLFVSDGQHNAIRKIEIPE